MLRTSSFATNALPYGLLAQLFSNPIKTATQNADQISALMQYNPIDFNNAGLVQFLQTVERHPPVFTIYQVGDAQDPASVVSFVSPNAPLFDVSV
jgi:hypothetical protein